MIDNYLFSHYPKFFERCGPPSVGFGWYPLIAALSKDLRQLCDAHGGYVVALQIKEKFGELRIYLKDTSTSPEAQQIAMLLIDCAIERSRTICEICGENGRFLYDKDFLRTRCDDHRNNDPEIVGDFLDKVKLLPLPELDFSILPGRSSIEIGDAVRLSTTRYRCAKDIGKVRIADIEIREDRGAFSDIEAAEAAGKAFGYPLIIRRYCNPSDR